MATYANRVRRGLPREPGGEPWPPVGSAPPAEQGVAPDSAIAGAAAPDTVVQEMVQDVAVHEAPSLPDDLVAVPIRRGLPRSPGGDPWPPAGSGLIRVKPMAPESMASESTAPEPTIADLPAARKQLPQVAAARAAPRDEPRFGAFTLLQWGG